MKCTFLMIFVLILASFSPAQIVSDFGVHWGVVSSRQNFEEISGNLSSVSLLSRNWRPRLGPQTGFFIRLNPPFLPLQSEICYLQKGTNEEIFQATVGSDGRYVEVGSETIEAFQFDYITFGIFLRPEVSVGQTDLFFLTGPSLNFLISNKELLFKDATRWTSAVVFGGGAEFHKFLPFPFFIELRYQSDLTYFFKNENLKSKFQIWQFILGISLKGDK